MKLYLALGGESYDTLVRAAPPYILSSFLSVNENILRYSRHPSCKGFMLDSGAFTFMNSKRDKIVDWDAYVARYAELIKSHNINLYYELDIDTIVGVGETTQLRRKLENLVGHRSIPVWHRCRGKAAYLKMIEEYNYVAVGGIATLEIRPSEHPILKWFVESAHRKETMIHGLGGARFCNPRWFIPFDSVDASSWSGCTRFGSWIKAGKRPRFDGSGLDYGAGSDGKMKWTGGSSSDRVEACLTEWAKFARYLDRM